MRKGLHLVSASHPVVFKSDGAEGDQRGDAARPHLSPVSLGRACFEISAVVEGGRRAGAAGVVDGTQGIYPQPQRRGGGSKRRLHHGECTLEGSDGDGRKAAVAVAVLVGEAAARKAAVM